MRRTVVLAVTMLLMTHVAHAQITPAAGYTPPDDTPSIRVGAVIYADYTYTQSPQTLDADGNLINFSQFNVSRSYINITGNISHIVSFRITPDIARETTTGAVLNGSLLFRIKYALMQINLDDWMPRGSWVRLGIQQTPWVDFEEGIYRYRFQGTVFSEREGFLSSSDAGASFHTNLASNYAEVHFGAYNGENYNRVEVNDQKALQIRASVRPFARGPLASRGLRAHVFFDADNYVKNAERKRAIGSVTFEHQYLNAGVQYLRAKDRPSVTRPDLSGGGYSIWATPRSRHGLEGLLRYDHLTPSSAAAAQVRTRTIVGVAYWFPHQGPVSSALLLDYDSANFDSFAPSQPKQTRIAVHGLVSF